ncbi:restriction endonuclease subunit S [Glaesserella parasuis]|uniref:restriction endonuclease subunit S n=1 Tax=Glaesserella parasuis TaxID=738 RepID=UPI001370331F|nr:restriction endonuclease subunit S [Glaesserella parasuis]MDG6303402.1 restriction endonuclease subunit S [Glaesserella parasuis]MDG6463215.1 restriction endonuclease subunit S [Glaesserella parasuis]MDG6467451.1 restriction endonuclease subunit S [Glaesserella parasuis]MDG6800127.1 restriction endonuclease subunit S [Glaesserella parasuis]MDG6823378.1 restriction endonuclease subunit S [Glaesserella parasuis]
MSSLSNLTIHSIGGGWGKDVEDEGLELVAVIRGTDIPNLEINNIQGVPFRYETQKKIQSRLLQIGDLVIEIFGGSASSKQRTGRCLYITDELLKNLGGKVIPASFCKLLRLDRKKVNSKYVYYQIKAMHLSDEIASFENQSTGISNFQFNRFIDEIRPSILDIEVQNKIVNFLEKIDLKIINNININQTLEQIAQTIFKSWFIDFDPVHAKANALASGQAAEQATQAAMAVISGKNTQELHRLQTANPEQYQQLWEIAEAFPSGVDEEGVPWGWEERYLKDVCNIVYGKGLPKNKLTEKGFYVFGANGVIGFYDSYTYEKPQVLIGCRGTVGQVTLSYPYSFVTNNSLVIEYENSCVSMYYLEKYLSNINLKEISSGSVQPQITIQNMSKVKILIPNIEILNFYSEKVKEIYDKRLHHFYENQSLSKVRDLLLPKLLSGEV